MNTLSCVCMVLVAAASSNARTFTFQNNRTDTIWVGALAYYGKPAPNGGGFKLAPGAKTSVDVDDDWSGHFWGRTNCNFDANGQGSCETGDCGNGLQCNGAEGAPPFTLAQITLNGIRDVDSYYISLADGFNVGITMVPSDSSSNGKRFQCKAVSCTADVLGECPEELKQTGATGVVACKSACLQFDTDLYCCRGDHVTAETCMATDWPVNYASYFKTLCPAAYSYAYDDEISTFTCMNTDYTITFN